MVFANVKKKSRVKEKALTDFHLLAKKGKIKCSWLVLASFSCQLDRAQSYLLRESQLGDCLDQTGL